MLDETVSGLGVFIIASRADDKEVEKLGAKLTAENFEWECDYDAPPGTRPPTELDKQLERYNRIVLILSRESTMCEWIKYCQAVLADRKPTIPLIVDPELKIEDLDICIQRLVCLKTTDDDWFQKLCKALKSVRKSGEAYCLPIAPVHPGICVNYFYGFLNFILPDFDQRLKMWQEHQGEMRANIVPKMLIIIPESCECEDQLVNYAPKHVSSYPDKQRSKVECAKNPLDASRNYDQHMYKIDNPDAPGESYYAVLVLCASMQALYEMEQDSTCGFTKDKMREEMKGFKKMLKKVLSRYQPFVNKADVVSFNDKDGPESFVRPIVEKCREIMN